MFMINLMTNKAWTEMFMINLMTYRLQWYFISCVPVWHGKFSILQAIKNVKTHTSISSLISWRYRISSNIFLGAFFCVLMFPSSHISAPLNCAHVFHFLSVFISFTFCPFSFSWPLCYTSWSAFITDAYPDHLTLHYFFKIIFRFFLILLRNCTRDSIFQWWIYTILFHSGFIVYL